MLANNKRLNNRYMFASWAEPTPEMIEQMGMKGANLPFMVLLKIRGATCHAVEKIQNSAVVAQQT